MKFIPLTEYFVFAIVIALLEIGIIFLLKKIEVADIPTDRSSHTIPTPRGGGIIFPIACIYWFITTEQQQWLFLTGVIALAIISFWDDIKSINPGVRFAVQLVSVACILVQTIYANWNILLLIFTLIVCLSFINAFNFMDGINGITGVYSLVALGSLLYVNESIVAYTSSELILLIIISVVVFLFFNFRNKALIFAGDVGSIVLAFVLIYLTLALINVSDDLRFVFFFLVYGIETFFTIIQRLLQGDIITKPHRKHLYQILVNEYGCSHLLISACYGILQLLINFIIIRIPLTWFELIAFLFIFSFFYTFLKYYLIKKLSVNDVNVRKRFTE